MSGVTDEKTRVYFNKLTPHFDSNRFQFAWEFICNHSDSNTRLIDIGCGDGATLLQIRQNTPVTLLSGMDVSEQYLNRVKKSVGCDTILGSILDANIISKYSDSYNFCLLGAVLHHLIGKNRAESYRAAQCSIINALTLLKAGGYIIIDEPVYTSIFLMDIVFNIKKFFSNLSDGRIELFAKWVNIGQPVVSYYTPRQIDEMISLCENAAVVKKAAVNEIRQGFILKRVSLQLIIQKIITEPLSLH